MRNKKLWKNMMLATACTVALGTASVPVLAAEVNTETGLAVESETAPDTQVTTPDAQVEADKQTPENKVAEPKLSITSDTTTFGTNGIVVTLKADFDGDVTFYEDMLTLDGEIVGSTSEQVSDKEMRIVINKDGFERAIQKNGYKNGQTAVLTTGCSIGYEDETGATKEVVFPTLTLTYSDGTETPDPDNGNGGTETPDPDNGNGNGGTENPDGNNGSGDNNGNTETPDGNGDNNTETPDGNNGNNGNTETPDGNNGNDTGNEQKPITGQTVKPATKTESTSPKTGDMSAVLPVLGTGITSLGVALTALFRKRK